MRRLRGGVRPGCGAKTLRTRLLFGILKLMSDASNPIDPVQLAILMRAKADAIRATDEVARLADTTGLRSALDSFKLLAAEGSRYQSMMTNINAQTAKIASMKAQRDPLSDDAFPNYKSHDQMSLEAQWELAKRLDQAIDVLTETNAIQRNQDESLSALYVSMEETTTLTRSLLRWAPWAVGVGAVAAIASVAGILIQLLG